MKLICNGREDAIILFIFVLKYDILILVYKIGEIFVLYTLVKYRGDMLRHISLLYIKNGVLYNEAAEKVIFFKNTNPLLYENQTYINICLPQ